MPIWWKVSSRPDEGEGFVHGEGAWLVGSIEFNGDASLEPRKKEAGAAAIRGELLRTLFMFMNWVFLRICVAGTNGRVACIAAAS